MSERESPCEARCQNCCTDCEVVQTDTFRGHKCWKCPCGRWNWLRQSGPQPPIESHPKDLPVGEGSPYEAMREEARKLVPLFMPGGRENSQSYWGAGICSLRRENDKNMISVETWHRERRGLGVTWEESIKILRASAISLLVYCEAYGE